VAVQNYEVVATLAPLNALKFGIVINFRKTGKICWCSWLHLHGEDVGNLVIGSTGTLPHLYMTSQPRRPRF